MAAFPWPVATSAGSLHTLPPAVRADQLRIKNCRECWLELNLWRRQFGELAHVRQLCEALRSNAFLSGVEVILTGSTFPPGGYSELLDTVLNQERLKRIVIRLGECKISTPQLGQLFSGVKVNHGVSSLLLDLSYNQLTGDESVDAICELLSRFPKLEELRLDLQGNGGIAVGCGQKLARALGRLPSSVRTLSLKLNSCPVGGTFAALLGESLRTKPIRDLALSLSHCGLGDYAMLVLQLAGELPLDRLSLLIASNALTACSLAALSAAIASCGARGAIDVSDNPILLTESTIQSLCTTLSECPPRLNLYCGGRHQALIDEALRHGRASGTLTKRAK